MKLEIKCPQCSKTRLVEKSTIDANKRNRKTEFTGICRPCYWRRKTDRPFETRPYWRRSDGYYEVCLPVTHWLYNVTSKHRETILVHRLVMAEYLGRPLQRSEIVHHVNGIKTDNRVENLQLTTKEKHTLSYQEGYRKGMKDGLELRDNGLEKQIKLLQWQIKELAQQLQFKENLFGV